MCEREPPQDIYFISLSYNDVYTVPIYVVLVGQSYMRRKSHVIKRPPKCHKPSGRLNKKVTRDYVVERRAVVRDGDGYHDNVIELAQIKRAMIKYKARK